MDFRKKNGSPFAFFEHCEGILYLAHPANIALRQQYIAFPPGKISLGVAKILFSQRTPWHDFFALIEKRRLGILRCKGRSLAAGRKDLPYNSYNGAMVV